MERPSRNAAIELNRKSQMVSEAVEEVLDLVQKATQEYANTSGADAYSGSRTPHSAKVEGAEGGDSWITMLHPYRAKKPFIITTCIRSRYMTT